MTRHSPLSWLVTGAGLGAASMYFLDPARGRRRRHRAVDRVRGAVRDVDDLASKAERDLKNRARGLEARVRGSHPARPTARRLLSEGTPERRLLEGGLGGLLALCGLACRGVARAAALTAAGALITRAAVQRQRGEIRVQKTLTIEAPIHEVFAFWSQFENFPRFMEHVLEVRCDGDRSHWRVAGPAGVALEWQAEITERIEDRKIAWCSLEGSAIAHRGDVRFDPIGTDATRITVHMVYAPPGGTLGHVAAGFLLGDPKALMDQDLLRFKSLLEHGRTRAHGQGVTRGDVHA